MATGESEKALRYIASLDSARCNAQWEKIPELTRKVAKHAPHRKCLITTAKIEAQVAEHDPSERLSAAAAKNTDTTASSPLLALIEPLLKAIDGETKYLEDAFQATVCVGWIHWVLREPGLAAARMPRDVIKLNTALDKESNQIPTSWTHVCAMKRAYIKGFSLEQTRDVKAEGLNEALEIYTSMIPFLTSLPLSLGSYNPEFRLWTERMLSRLVAVSLKSRPLEELEDFESMLQIYHLWMSLFRVSPSNPKLLHSHEPTERNPSPIELGLEVNYSRWDVWMAYYDSLSEILRRGYVYSSTYTYGRPKILRSRDGIGDDGYLNVRLQQRTEIKNVEARIEKKLLEETRFPRANERNYRVERWVDSIVLNWRIMCGPTWQDAELGEGGKNAIARGVLDILYRAATKTFHSTQILRFLFSVHAYLAEFDLAFKAFDSYIEIVQRGKDREEKSGEPDYSLDNDDTVLHTASEAIRILCRFGSRHEAEKAREICLKLEEWLREAEIDLKTQQTDNNGPTLPGKPVVSPKLVSEAYRALGISESHWARLTYDASARNGHQQQAVDFFRIALKPQYTNAGDLETRYSLAFVLAEMRELSSAIKIVKQTLAQRPTKADASASFLTNGSSFDDVDSSDTVDFARERKLIPFWHLLSLLLTAKADLVTAVRSCNAAFEQFDDLVNLLGSDKEFRSEHLSETDKGVFRSPKALIDKMQRSEKEGIIQVRITQIALMETMESPLDAIDASVELLALYARFFDDPKSDLEAHARLTTAKPPKSSRGSLRYSILSRAKSRRRGDKTSATAPSTTTAPDPSTRPSTMATATTGAPTIQITDEDGAPPRGRPRNGNRHSIFRNISLHAGVEIKRNSSRKLQKRSRSGSQQSPDSHRTLPTTTANDTGREKVVVPRASLDGGVPGNDRLAPSVVETTIREEPIENDDVTKDDVTHERRRPGPLNMHPPTPTLEEKPAVQSPSHSSTSQSETRPLSEKKSFGSSPLGSLCKESHNFQPPEMPRSLEGNAGDSKQNTRLLGSAPFSGNITLEPVFSNQQERRQNVTLLIELWLFVGELYSRGKVFDDAKGAIDEAADLVQALEAETSKNSSSAKAFGATGWGGGKSVEELWGDVWARRGRLAKANSLPFEAMAHYEKALSHFPDHTTAIVGLSELLLDIYCRRLAPEPPDIPTFTTYSTSDSPFASRLGLRTSAINLTKTENEEAINESETTLEGPIPYATVNVAEELNRLAARDRAYILLSTLTKLGTGWDYSEAWFALARAYEESGQIEKAKEVLWWCVELEDTRPLRHWRNVQFGGFGIV